MNFSDLKQLQVMNKLKGDTTKICLVRCYGAKSGEIVNIRKRNRSWIEVEGMSDYQISIRKAIPNKGCTSIYQVRGESHINEMLEQMSPCVKITHEKYIFAAFRVI